MAIIGVIFSLLFVVHQLIPNPGLEGIQFGTESYIMLLIWIAIGVAFYLKQRKHFMAKKHVSNRVYFMQALGYGVKMPDLYTT